MALEIWGLWKTSALNRLMLSSARAGLGRRLDAAPPPFSFVANSVKAVDCNAAVLLHAFVYILSTLFLKDSVRGHLRLGHQIKWSKNQKYLQLGSGWRFQVININLLQVDNRVSTQKTCILEFWCRWPDVRSISWQDHYKAMGKCSNAFHSESARGIMLIISRLCNLRPLSMTHKTQWPLLPVIRAIWGQIRFWTPLQNIDRAVRLVTMCFSCQDASTDMQHDQSGSRRDLTWPWPEVKFWPRHFKINMHIFRQVSAGGTRWRPNYFASLLTSRVVCEKSFLSKRLFWHLLTPTA